MSKIGTLICSLGFVPRSLPSYSRFERRIGLTEILLLLIFVMTLAACENPVGSNDTGANTIIATTNTGSPDPAVTAPANITVAATNSSGAAATNPTITSFLNAASAFDAVDGAIATIINDAPGIFPLGTTTVTFSATDSDGNTSTAQATVTVADQTAPVITLLGTASITLNVGDPFTDPGAIASDNVDGALTPAIVTGGSVNTGSVGLYTLTYNVSDAAGNAAVQVTRSVSVQDVGAPVVTPPIPITVAAVDATGTAASDAAIMDFLADASAFDTVDGVIAPTNDAPSQFPLGLTTVTFSATDSSSNIGQAQATVNVTDQTAPTVTAPAEITVVATSLSGIAVTDPAIVAFLGGASATDNVDGAIVTIGNNAPTPLLPVGDTTVTFSATDAAGNLGTAQATVTVTAPVVSLQMIAFSRNVGGQLDLFAVAEDGSGPLVTLADDPGDEVFGGSTSDNRVIYVRDTGGGLNDIFSISDDGSDTPITLTTDPADELPVAVTAANEVIFMRTTVAPADIDLLSVSAGGGAITPLATSTDIELFGGLTSDGWLVYDRTDGLFQADVYSISADGSSGMVSLATDVGEFEAGAGIANGTLVIFARTVGGLGGPSNIYTIEADGSSLESLLIATGDNELPIGVTAGNLVIFTRTTPLFMSSLMSVGASGSPGVTLLATSDILFTGDQFFYGGSTGARVIYHRCDFLQTECDVFSRSADASDPEVTLAGDPALNEVFAGISSDGRVIIVRDNGDGTTDLLSIDAAGGATAIVLATAPTPVPPGEVFKGVTANGRVIFERTVSGQTDLFSIMADGSALEESLATAPLDDDFFGGIF